MGRPKLTIAPSDVTKLASYGLNNREIAEFLGCSEASLSTVFKENVLKGKADLKMKLRRKQIDVALGGNVSMLIWLGKNILDQSDKQVITRRIADYSLDDLVQILNQEDSEL